MGKSRRAHSLGDRLPVQRNRHPLLQDHKWISEPSTLPERLLFIYAVANNARYLLRQFRNDSFVAELSAAHSQRKLLTSISALSADNRRSPEGTVLAYACVVALGLKFATDPPGPHASLVLWEHRIGSRDHRDM